MKLIKLPYDILNYLFYFLDNENCYFFNSSLLNLILTCKFLYKFNKNIKFKNHNFYKFKNYDYLNFNYLCLKCNNFNINELSKLDFALKQLHYEKNSNVYSENAQYIHSDNISLFAEKINKSNIFKLVKFTKYCCNGRGIGINLKN